MDKISRFMEVFCTKIVFLIGAVMFGVLTYWAAIYTHEFPGDYSMEKAYGVFDSPAANLAVMIVVLLMVYVLQKLLMIKAKEKQKKRVFLFLLVDLILVGIWGVIWVTGCHIMPYADQYQVYLTAVEYSKGNFTDMNAYFYMCPQQYGLAFLYECILWIWESYHFVQYINVIFLLMIVFFSYKISEALTDRPEVGFYTVLAANAFLPLMIYVNFIYGEMGTIAMCMWSIWSVLKWMQTDKKCYGIMAVISMVLALMVRLNMIIVTIALAIVLVITAVRKKNWRPCVLAVLLFVVPLGSIRAVEFSYELRSGNQVGKGIPTSLNIAMGMQQSWQGAGAFNSYNQTTFWSEAGGNSEIASEIGWEYIKGRLKEFAADPAMAKEFYRDKILEQWNMGSFGSLFMTNHFDAAPFAPAQSLYGGELQAPALGWMNRYVFVMYFSVFLYSLHGLVRVKEMKKSVLPMIAVGGMIFSLLWEAKSRYVFPYVVMILPCVAMGLHICHMYMGMVGRKALEGCKGIKEKVKWIK